MLKKFIRWYKVKTHRTIATNVITKENLSDEYRFAPQWWLLWWHFYYIPAGYDFYVPRSYKTIEESTEYLLNKIDPPKPEKIKTKIYPME